MELDTVSEKLKHDEKIIQHVTLVSWKNILHYIIHILRYGMWYGPKTLKVIIIVDMITTKKVVKFNY